VLRTSIGVGGAASGRRDDWDEKVRFAVEAEGLGVDVVWSAEAWGQDAVAPLAYLAAVTSRIKLGTNIMQVTPRTPSLTAMTALTMASISKGRFILGLGVSGPQVVEGLHGVPFQPALTRLREHVEIVRLAFAGEPLEYHGQVYDQPRPGGEGKRLRLAQPANPDIPLYLGTLGPKSLAYTGAVADGWCGTALVPEAAEALFAPMRMGAERAGRRFEDLDIVAGARLGVGDDVEQYFEDERRKLLNSLGAMGSARTNFYNRAYQRAGYADEAREVQRLWKAGRRDDALALVPDELVHQVSFLGTPEMVRERLRAYRDAGVTTLRFEVIGRTVDEQLEHLARGVELVQELNRAEVTGAGR
jgi:F420-dependent oxidoreductase-like protein